MASAFNLTPQNALELIAPKYLLSDKLLSLLTDGEDAPFGWKFINSTKITFRENDPIRGLMQARGYNNPFAKIGYLGYKEISITPAILGEQLPFDEAFLTLLGDRNSLSQSTGRIQEESAYQAEQLVGRAKNRIISWLLGLSLPITTSAFNTTVNGVLLAAGSMSVGSGGTSTTSISLPNGTQHYTDTYNFPQYTALIPFSTVASATPRAVFTDIIRAWSRQSGCSFGPGAIALITFPMLLNLMSNRNTNDLYGDTASQYLNIRTLDAINEVMRGYGLPKFVVIQPEENFYFDDAGAQIPFLPDNKILLYGKSHRNKVGDFWFTRNANYDGEPLEEFISRTGAMPSELGGSVTLDGVDGIKAGFLMKSIYRGGEEMPVSAEVYSSIHGSPVVYNSDQIVTITA